MQNNHPLVRYFSIFLIIGLFLSSISILKAQTSQNYDYTLVPQNFSFTRDLSYGNQDPAGQNDVKYLQCVLGIIPPSGYFGDLTKATLTQFQNDHAEEVLAPVGLTQGQATGFFGSSTRNYINAQIAVEGSTSGSRCGGTTGSNSYLPLGCISTVGFSTVTGVRCDSGVTTNGNNLQNPNQNPSNGNQQNPMQSLLPLLPFFLSQGGTPHLVNPNQPYNSNTNPYVQNSVPNVNDPRFIGPPANPGGQNPPANGNGVLNNGANQGANAANPANPNNPPASQTTTNNSTFGEFGGLTTYNSFYVTNKFNTPCGCSYPDVSYVINDNKYYSHSPVEITDIRLLYLKNSSSLLGNLANPVPGTCSLGRYVPITQEIRKRCLNYVTENGVTTCKSLPIIPIDGVITEINSGGSAACQTH